MRASRAEEPEAEAETERGFHDLIEFLLVEVRRRSGVGEREEREGERRAVEEDGGGERVMVNAMGVGDW